jgi:hypothetical protein
VCTFNPTLVPSTLTGGLLTAKVPVASEVWVSVGAVESDVVAHGFELVECPGLGSFGVELSAVVLAAERKHSQGAHVLNHLLNLR